MAKDDVQKKRWTQRKANRKRRQTTPIGWWKKPFRHRHRISFIQKTRLHGCKGWILSHDWIVNDFFFYDGFLAAAAPELTLSWNSRARLPSHVGSPSYHFFFKVVSRDAWLSKSRRRGWQNRLITLGDSARSRSDSYVLPYILKFPLARVNWVWMR